MGYYDTAQICLNGHVITDQYDRSPEFRRAFCKRCGKKTITACEACATSIQGDYTVPEVMVIGGGMMDAPAYCHACGHPYPWTMAKVVAAKALAEELAELTEPQRIMLRSSIDDIASETPMTEVAVLRVKNLIRGLPAAAGETVRKLIVDVASETAAKLLKG